MKGAIRYTAVMLPREREDTARTCGHMHRELEAVENCVRRLRARWPRVPIVAAMSLSPRDFA